MGDLVGDVFPDPAADARERLRVTLLGPLTVTIDGSPVELGPPKQRSLLAILLLHRGEVVSTDRIIDLLWGEHPPRTADHSVQLYVSNLRRALAGRWPHPIIVTRRPGYLVDLPAETVDLVRFEQLADRGHRALADDDTTATDLLTAAVGLWRGDPLTDCALEGFAEPEIGRLEEVRLRTVEDLADAWLAAGDAACAVEWAARACREDRYRDRCRELLMLALYRSGRHREALQAYSTYRNIVREELGLDPTPTLARLQERILVHDPTLVPRIEASSTVATGRNPFKGLRPFQTIDADDFFGRDRLTDEILERLDRNQPIVAVVGPSGSGKSSVLAAGVLPRLQASDGSALAVVEAVPDMHDPAAIEELVAQAHASPAAGPHPPAGGPVILMMDQFEEHLLALDEVDLRHFLDRLTRLTDESGVQLLMALRADLYDRPLSHPAFARSFADGVVNVLPMTAAEVESAVVAPAERAGVSVEPALLAELVAATADRAAQLPLLQYALTELFDRGGRTLTLAGYQAIGGLQAALTRRAEQIRRRWDDQAAAGATQVLLRLVRVESGKVVRRRAQVGELGALAGIDPATVSEVLRDLTRHHLITYDRERHTGRATVEAAHDALFEHWPWLADLVRRHRAALERHGALRVALEEWLTAGRDEDYLLRGARLDQFQLWRDEGVLSLTDQEAGFLDACQAKADEEVNRDQQLTELRHRLERRARRRLAVSIAAALSAVAAIAVGIMAGAEDPPQVGLVYHRVGFIDYFMEAGFDRAAAERDFTLVKADVDSADAPDEIEGMIKDGRDLIVVATNETDVAPIASRNPDVHFLVVADLTGTVEAPNVTDVQFADQDGAFLAGAAAALASESGVLGFIGGVNTPSVLRFNAGFVAGARAVDPGVKVLTEFLSRLPDYGGFTSPPLAREATVRLVQRGADVVFPVAGGSQFGALAAVAELSERLDRHIWAIGVDEDVYEDERWPTSPTATSHVLTSVVKRFDLAIYDAVLAFMDGDLRPGERVYDLSNGGIELTTSGGFLTPFGEQLQRLREEIETGRIVVPCIPHDLAGAEAAIVGDGPGCPGSPS